MSDAGLTRRTFLFAAASATALPAEFKTAHARTIKEELPWAPRQADVPEPVQSPNYLFFTAAESAFIDAATERLIPKDDLGPGAHDAGVTLFIDHQLAGSFGRAERWYMQGPWRKGEETQGFQSRMPPAQLYRAAIEAIDHHTQLQHAKPFAQLTADQQDHLLTDLENGALDLQGVDAKAFFKMLLQNTKEGMFSDPIYGGNKDMSGWKMLGFPGARYDYSDWVDKHGERYTLPAVGLMGRAAWQAKG